MSPENLELAMTLIPIELWNTVAMVFVSTFLATLFGLPLGVILTVTDKGHLKENPFIHETLGTIVNMGRSFPFAILMIAVIPITRAIVGTSLGTVASIVPLTIAAIPFIARMVEVALNEVDKSLIESASVMGSTPFQIIHKVLIRESYPSLILAITSTIINLIGYSAMAGTMGGGGLGKVAIQYGYLRFNTFLIIVTVIVLILLVQLVQWVGNTLAKRINQKRGKVYAK